MGEFTAVIAGSGGLGVRSGVVFGEGPFVGGIANKFTATVNMLGDAGAVGALVLAIVVG